jgi:hypothetical protein
MQVRELVQFLQGVDQDADVRLVADHAQDLEQDMLSMVDGSLVVDLQDFMNEEEDFQDELGAL